MLNSQMSASYQFVLNPNFNQNFQSLPKYISSLKKSPQKNFDISKSFNKGMRHYYNAEIKPVSKTNYNYSKPLYILNPDYISNQLLINNNNSNTNPNIVYHISPSKYNTTNYTNLKALNDNSNLKSVNVIAQTTNINRVIINNPLNSSQNIKFESQNLNQNSPRSTNSVYYYNKSYSQITNNINNVQVKNTINNIQMQNTINNQVKNNINNNMSNSTNIIINNQGKIAPNLNKSNSNINIFNNNNNYPIYYNGFQQKNSYSINEFTNNAYNIQQHNNLDNILYQKSKENIEKIVSQELNMNNQIGNENFNNTMPNLKNNATEIINAWEKEIKSYNDRERKTYQQKPKMYSFNILLNNEPIKPKKDEVVLGENNNLSLENKNKIQSQIIEQRQNNINNEQQRNTTFLDIKNVLYNNMRNIDNSLNNINNNQNQNKPQINELNINVMNISNINSNNNEIIMNKINSSNIPKEQENQKVLNNINNLGDNFMITNQQYENKNEIGFVNNDANKYLRENKVKEIEHRKSKSESLIKSNNNYNIYNSNEMTNISNENNNSNININYYDITNNLYNREIPNEGVENNQKIINNEINIQNIQISPVNNINQNNFRDINQGNFKDLNQNNYKEIRQENFKDINNFNSSNPIEEKIINTPILYDIENRNINININNNAQNNTISEIKEQNGNIMNDMNIKINIPNVNDIPNSNIIPNIKNDNLDKIQNIQNFNNMPNSNMNNINFIDIKENINNNTKINIMNNPQEENISKIIINEIENNSNNNINNNNKINSNIKYNTNNINNESQRVNNNIIINNININNNISKLSSIPKIERSQKKIDFNIGNSIINNNNNNIINKNNIQNIENMQRPSNNSIKNKKINIITESTQSININQTNEQIKIKDNNIENINSQKDKVENNLNNKILNNNSNNLNVNNLNNNNNKDKINNLNNNINNKKEDIKLSPKTNIKKKSNRPMYKIPPSKKRSISQGNSLAFIHKYYDENFIMEEENEDIESNKEDKKITKNRNKTKEFKAIKIKKINKNDEKNSNNKQSSKINLNIIKKKIDQINKSINKGHNSFSLEKIKKKNINNSQKDLKMKKVINK